MSQPDDSVSIWIQKLGQGDEQAAQEIWSRYFQRLVNQVRGKLAAVPRRVFDEEDIAASAMGSLLVGIKENRFRDVSSRDNLWNLLLGIASTKIRDQKRNQLAQKRGGGKVRGESAFMPITAAGLNGIEQVLGSEPTPELAAEIAESCRSLLSSLGDEQLKEVALLKLHGHTNEEIAERTNRGISTVERRLKRIREKWAKSATASSSDS